MVAKIKIDGKQVIVHFMSTTALASVGPHPHVILTPEVECNISHLLKYFSTLLRCCGIPVSCHFILPLHFNNILMKLYF